jgi:plastocyanin
VVVYLYTGRGGSDLDYDGGDPQTVVLANKDCQFEPHIVLAKVGDTLKVTNPDEVGHNANIQFFKNKAINPTIPAGREVMVELKEAEPAPIPVTCNIHPWMRARLVVLEHPFAGVSDADGHLTIKGLPAGETFVFRAFHERARIKEATMDGKTVKWKRSRFEVEIKPGMNDLGTVVLGADQFN